MQRPTLSYEIGIQNGRKVSTVQHFMSLEKLLDSLQAQADRLTADGTPVEFDRSAGTLKYNSHGSALEHVAMSDADYHAMLDANRT
jgi:hypothetical protein